MSEQPTLIHIISSNKWGGAQQYASDICDYYKNIGWNVTVVTRDAKVVDDHFKNKGIEILHAPLRGFFDPASAVMLAGYLRKIPRDSGYVHVHHYRDAFTILLAKRLARRPDIRLISTRHAVKRGRNSRLYRRVYDKINAHIFVSRAAFEYFIKTWPDKLPMRQDTIHILLNSINIARSDRAPEPSKGPLFALYLGPVVKGKGIENIIDAMALLKGLRLRLRIAGKGNPDYLDELRRRAMAGNVMEMIDWKTGSEASDELISQSHFAVLPSMEREAFGLSNLRVMAAGRPQICTTTGAQPEYLTDGETAIFIPPADTASLAEAMKKLAADPELRLRIGTRAFEHYCRSLSWESFIPSLTEIYKNA